MGSEPAPLFKLLNIWYVYGVDKRTNADLSVGHKALCPNVIGFHCECAHRCGTCECTRMPGMHTVVFIFVLALILFHVKRAENLFGQNKPIPPLVPDEIRATSISIPVIPRKTMNVNTAVVEGKGEFWTPLS